MAAEKSPKPKYNLRQLLDSTTQHFPNRFANAKDVPPRIKSFVVTPFVGAKYLAVRAEVEGKAEDKIYKVIMVFYDVSFSNKKDSYHSVKVKVDDKLSVWMKPIGDKNQVRVRCGCKDAYFTSLWWLFGFGNLYGVKPKPYKRKTPPPPDGYPYRNPKKVAMLCKHIVATMRKAMKSRYWK